MAVGDRIKQLRKELPGKLSQEKFGLALGTSRDVISNLEQNRVEPNEVMLRHICQTYNVSYLWLKEGIGPMYSEPDADYVLIDRILSGQNEFAKSVFRAFAKLGDEEWEKLRDLIENIHATYEEASNED